jgi:D-lyxose ketol-isomerase
MIVRQINLPVPESHALKRSQVNAILEKSLRLLEQMQFHLPSFAHWSPQDWASKGPECASIVRRRLGWDITDFGLGDFDRLGLVLFTIRNGTLDELAKPNGKIYAEKILIAQPGQITPAHFHFKKMEDIINRGGGDLMVQLWNATPDEKFADTPVRVECDSTFVDLPAGGVLRLKPGESVTLPTRLYHKFWADSDRATVLIGEVSMVNDDHTDNRFAEPMGRFATIEEDQAPLRLLCGEYDRYYRHG